MTTNHAINKNRPDLKTDGGKIRRANNTLYPNATREQALELATEYTKGYTRGYIEGREDAKRVDNQNPPEVNGVDRGSIEPTALDSELAEILELEHADCDDACGKRDREFDRVAKIKALLTKEQVNKGIEDANTYYKGYKMGYSEALDQTTKYLHANHGEPADGRLFKQWTIIQEVGGETRGV